MNNFYLMLFAAALLASCTSIKPKVHASNLSYLTNSETLEADDAARGLDAQTPVAQVSSEEEEPVGPIAHWKREGMVQSLGYGDDEARDVHVDFNGNMIIVGSSLTAESFFDFAILSYRPDGSKNMSFGKAGRVSTDFAGGADFANAIAIQPDGKFLVAGYTKKDDKNFAIARYHANGKLDRSFGRGGRVVTDFSDYKFPKSEEDPLRPEEFLGKSDDVIQAIDVHANGKIVVGGYATGGVIRHFALAQYLPNGKLDKSFGQRGRQVTRIGMFEEEVKSINIQPDGKIVASGYSEFSYPGKTFFLMTRYLPNGKLDSKFGENGSVITGIGKKENSIESAKIQGDGKIVVAGYASNLLGGYDYVVARYLENGTLDSSFGEDGTFNRSLSGGVDKASSVQLQADGKIVVAGTISVARQQQVVLIRLTEDGALDKSFGSSGIMSSNKSLTPNRQDQAHGLAIQPDGSIVVVGKSQNEGYGADVAVIRYSAE